MGWAAKLNGAHSFTRTRLMLPHTWRTHGRAEGVGINPVSTSRLYLKIWGTIHAKCLPVLGCSVKSNSTEKNAKFTRVLKIKYKILKQVLAYMGVSVVIFTDP